MSFRSDPAGQRWTGPKRDGCVDDDADPPRRAAEQLRDAAFHALVSDDLELRALVREELLAQAREPDLDFSDGKHWCPGVYDRSPSFGISSLMIKLALAYDYLGEQAFTDDEHVELRSWFRAAAEWLQTDVEDKLDENFTDRAAGDHSLSQLRMTDPGWGRVGFLGSQETGAIARYYNNRRSTAMFFVALVGYQQGDRDLIQSSHRYVEEWLAFSVYPDGWTGEFERWRDDLPDLGWAYSTYNASLAVMIADLAARHGDSSLHSFTTSKGIHGTEGSRKSLHSVLLDHARYLDGSYERYGTDREEHEGDDDYLIDGEHEPEEWYSVHDIAWVMANRFYRDNYLRSIYLRSGPGTSSYPAKVASQGGSTPWSGVWGIYPGVLFMFGQMEEVPMGSTP